MTRLVTSVDNTLNDPQFSHGAGDTMRGAFTSSTSRGATVSCSSVGLVSIAALPALMEESTSCGLSLESALIYYASDIPRPPYTTSTAADGLGIHGAHDTCSVNPFSSSSRCHASATSANRSSRSTPRNNSVRITSSPYDTRNSKP